MTKISTILGFASCLALASGCSYNNIITRDDFVQQLYGATAACEDDVIGDDRITAEKVDALFYYFMHYEHFQVAERQFISIGEYLGSNFYDEETGELLSMEDLSQKLRHFTNTCEQLDLDF